MNLSAVLCNIFVKLKKIYKFALYFSPDGGIGRRTSFRD